MYLEPGSVERGLARTERVDPAGGPLEGVVDLEVGGARVGPGRVATVDEPSVVLDEE